MLQMKVVFDLPQCNLMNNLISLGLLSRHHTQNKEIVFWLHFVDVIFIIHYPCDIWSHQDYHQHQHIHRRQKHYESLSAQQGYEDLVSQSLKTFTTSFSLILLIAAVWDLVNKTFNFPLGLIIICTPANQIRAWCF